MAKGVSISPTTVRIPESLREALAVRASKNGRSVNSEIVMILQAAIDEEKSPRSIEGFAQQESEKFREALLKTLSSMYGE
ncbi:TPA: Arc family DNA-binding protein, partial [Escherichia coli]|nr:Arc family DNA-binding protein [Escherichia coli]